MGLFDTTIYYSYQSLDIASLGQFISNTFGEKYTVKINEKQTGVKKIVTGNPMDTILVTKNAYHRLMITLYDSGDIQTDSGNKEFYLNFAKAPSKGWMKSLRRETGAIGGIVLRLIFGNADGFQSEVIKAIEEKYNLQSKKVGLGGVVKQ